VVRVAFQVTGDWDDALDVAQGVFLRLWKNLDRYDPARKFDTWLYRVTANAAIDLLRSRGPKGYLQPLPEDHGELRDESAENAESALDAAELQQAFRRLAAGLAPKQRMVFVLKEIEGLETAEVARIMNVAESTVRNHLLQARRVLRAGLERDYPGLVPGSARRGNDEVN
jgi:RNA polymerase sigma-70 factor (ECF subfamily)